MSWSVVVLIILVFAMMVGPILMIRPSPRDRRIAELRAKASKLGLRVSMQSLQKANFAVYELPWGREEHTKLVGVEWMLERQSYTHEVHFADWWQWQGEGRPPAPSLPLLLARMQAMPEGVAAVEATRLGLRCYWSEAGGEQRLLQLEEWLKTTAAIMKPYILRPPASVD